MVLIQTLSLVLFFSLSIIWLVSRRGKFFLDKKVKPKSLVEVLLFASLITLLILVISQLLGSKPLEFFLDFPYEIGLIAIAEELFFRATSTQTIGENPTGLLYSLLMPLLFSSDFLSYLELVVFFAAIHFASNHLRKNWGLAYSILFRIFLIGILVVQNQSSSFIIELLLLLVPIYYYSKLFPNKAKKWLYKLGINLKDGSLIKQILIGIGLAFLIFLIIQIEGIILTPLGLQDSTRVVQTVSSFSVLTLLMSITLTPIAEETFFRGFLQEKIGIIFTSVLFALAHFAYSSVVEFLAAFTAAIILGLYVQRQKNHGIVPTIIAHSLINLTALLIIFVH